MPVPLRRIALSWALAAAPAVAPAWGGDGHRIGCEIAWQELAPPARAAVRELLPGRGRYRYFNEACTWPDAVRDPERHPEYRVDDRRHYVNVPRGAAGPERERDCPRHCVLEAIDFYAGVLRDGPRAGRTRAQALRFLGHFVLDVHQPLHVAYASDRGGNALAVRYHGRDPRCRRAGARRRCAVNLHRLWDTLLVRAGLRRHRAEGWLDYAQALHETIAPAERRAWIASAPAAWAQESYDLVRRRVYPFADGETVDASRVGRLVPVVERRLQQGGVRLGALLNRLLAGPGD